MKKKPQKQKKKLTRHRITFEKGDQNETLAMAMMGQSDWSIRNATRNRVSRSQINSWLHKSKVLQGNKFGYRVDFRNGTSPFAQQLLHDYLGIIREEIRRTITPKIIHPTPEVISHE